MANITVNITGQLLIGGHDVDPTGATFHAINPANRQTLPPAFATARPEDIALACTLAAQAFDAYRATTPEQRASFLERIAGGIEALGAPLVERAMAEMGGNVAAGDGCSAQAVVHQTSAENWLAKSALEDEIFGPSSLLVRCDDLAQLRAIAERLSGQLTVTLQLEAGHDGDLEIARTLLPVLERKAGRILANGFPTGVEVGHAMVHGGPFPATSDGRSTSVGASAISRFLRSVCYQDLPDSLLPTALRDANLGAAWRLVDGTLMAPAAKA
jgi:alpha-ketoglutaric semialdehyde dehydrogenase